MPREERPVCAEMLEKLRFRMDEDTTPAPIMSDHETVRECVSMEDMAALLKVAEAHGWRAPLKCLGCNAGLGITTDYRGNEVLRRYHVAQNGVIVGHTD